MQKRKEKTLTSKDFLSTGSTLLNLSCTDNPNRGFAKGRYYLLVGTSSSGKTFLSLTCLAEAARNPNFKDYMFILDDVERGAMMDISKFFGKKVDKRLKRLHSFTIEDFYDNLNKAFSKDRPFIYILDSMDALTSEFEIAKFAAKRLAREKDKETAGSYGDGKAKVNSQSLRQAIGRLEDNGSILIVINQTRDKLVGFGGKTRSGGHAMQFYACLEIWSDIKTRIKKVYRKKEREQGKICTLRVRKNRVKGKDRIVQIPIYHSYGIDDVGSCVDYLVSEHHWPKNKSGTITATEVDFTGKRELLINHIVIEEMEEYVANIVASVWKDIEDAVSIKRKPKYE
jgi:RecA/RadA recombinase